MLETRANQKQVGKLRGRYILNRYVFEQTSNPKVFYNSISSTIVKLKRELAGFPSLPVHFGTGKVLFISARCQKRI